MTRWIGSPWLNGRATLRELVPGELVPGELVPRGARIPWAGGSLDSLGKELGRSPWAKGTQSFSLGRRELKLLGQESLVRLLGQEGARLDFLGRRELDWSP